MATATQQTALPRDASRHCVEVDAPAKINLFLEVLGKRADGFHELETVICPISLRDRLRLELRADDRIVLTISHAQMAQQQPALPTDQNNLIVRALDRLREISRVDRSLGCNVLLQKNIPVAAGLGGASSDAAAALLAGRALWRLNISDRQLREIAADLGSDVPFFLYGGGAICRGRGERIEPLKIAAGIPVVIAQPPTGLLTSLVFKAVEIPNNTRSVAAIAQSVVAGRTAEIAKQMFNRLQGFAMAMNAEIETLARAFSRTHCLGHQLTGSGSCYFGIFSSVRVARLAAQSLSNRLPDVRIFCNETISLKSNMQLNSDHPQSWPVG